MTTKNLIIISIVFTAFLLQGCLLFNTVSYEIEVDSDNSGAVTVVVNDIRSNALNSKELNEDKEYLFQFALNSEDFVLQMKEEGKNITSRELYVANDILYGKVKYSFENITNVEGIVYDEPFYYLTLALDDSVISTNGEIVHSDEHKRIIWDNSINILKFSMFGEKTDNKKLVGMAQFYQNGK